MAAGKGTRMQSNIPKVIHKIYGETLLNHVINTSYKLKPEKIVVVVGYKSEDVKKSIKMNDIIFSLQKEQKGTAHAVMTTTEHLKKFKGHTLILSGDVPFVREKTLRGLINKQINNNFDASVLTADLNDPTGYGRVIRDNDNYLKEIKEHKDCLSNQLDIKEINSGIYIFKNEILFKLLPIVKNDNAQSEYYLPDILSMIVLNKGKIGLKKIKNYTEILGINTLEQLKNFKNKNNKLD